MLIVTQKEDAWITIEPVDGLDLSMTLREAFVHGPILINLVHVGSRRVRLGIQAPGSFKVLRGRSPSADADAAHRTLDTPLALRKGR